MEGEFDYIIAHGVYSWVPAPVRDALFDLASRCLSRNGLMFVSYNTYPGCHVRRAAWEIMHLHIDAIEGAAARLDAARVLCKALGEPAMTQVDSDAALRGEFLRLARQSDSALCHDDLAQPNDPVYFRDFVAHAERHGLQFLAEAKLSMMSDAGVTPGIRQLLAGMDRLSREQYLDFARLRRFRSSLLCRARTGADFALRPDRLANLLVCASSGVVRAAAEGKLAQLTAASSPQQRGETAVQRRGSRTPTKPRTPTRCSAGWLKSFRGRRPSRRFANGTGSASKNSREALRRHQASKRCSWRLAFRESSKRMSGHRRSCAMPASGHSRARWRAGKPVTVNKSPICATKP